MWPQTLFPPLGRRALGRVRAELPGTLPTVSRKQAGGAKEGKGGPPLRGLSPPHPGSTLSPTAEKVSSLGKNWHRFCLKCERCHSVLSPGGHAEVRPGQGAQPCICHCPLSTSPQFRLRRLTKGNLSKYQDHLLGGPHTIQDLG